MKKILIVEGNLREENESFSENGIQTHTESLKDSLSHFTDELSFDVVNPSSDQNIQLISDQLEQYDGLIWGGSSLNIYNDTPEIRRQIEFMKNCQNKVGKILAICWGMQVAVTAAGGQVKKADNSHIGIANEIEINKNGIKHPLYKNKDKKFNTPAFNFDEVVTLPNNGICLASNKVNKIQSIYFEINNNKIWGLQYHPDYEYWQMINLSHARIGKMIANNYFQDEEAFKKHLDFIKSEEKKLDFKNKTHEIRNWLHIIKH